MPVLVDTNVLLRIADKHSSRHATALQSTNLLLATSESLVTVPQVAYEFWAAATRTVEANGLGMSVADADRSLQEMIEIFPLLRDERGVFHRWRTLVRQYQVKGVNSYDARIVAAMQRHSIDKLLTFNAGDFNRYAGITVLTPDAVLTNE